MRVRHFVVGCVLAVLLAGGAWGQCSCPRQSDPNFNGISFEVGDAVMMVNFLFFGYDYDHLVDSVCACNPADIDCNGTRDAVDLVKLIRVITGDASPEWFCTAAADCSVEHCASTPSPMSGNDVFIESKTVPAGAQDVGIGIYLLNDRDVDAVVLPLEMRALTPGSFVTGTIQLTPQGRLASSGLLVASANGFDDTPAAVGACGGPASGTYDSVVAASPLVPASPLGVLWAGVGFRGVLTQGFDGYPGNGIPSLNLTFDVTSTEGQFEIDSCCWAPANHLLFVATQNQTPILPTFTKGVITIGTAEPFNCDCHADPRCDGLPDLIDVVGVITAAFREGDVTMDPTCPFAREDVNCSGVVDVVDVVSAIHVILRDGDASVEFCDPADL